MRLCLCASLTLAMLGCEGPERPVQVELRPPQDEVCLPTALSAARLQALSDAPVSERVETPLQLVTESGFEQLGPFAPDTRGFRVIAQGPSGWQGGGVGLLGVADAVLVPVLRFHWWCQLRDPELALLPGASVVSLPDGRLALIAGSQGDEAPPSDRVTVMTPGEPLAEREAILLFRGRVRGTATQIAGTSILVAGGALREDGGALDTLDWVDIDSGQRIDGRLGRPRYDHGAARLQDGSVVLVGGASLGGLVSIAERVSFDDDEPIVEDVGSAVQRRGLTVLTLDDGMILAVGGAGNGGRVEPAIERWDGARFASVGAFPTRADAAYVALEGARVAMVGGRTADGVWTGEVDLLEPDGEVVSLGAVLPPLETPRAVGLGDGRLLVVGIEEGVRRTSVLDPGGTRPDDTSIGSGGIRGVPDALVRLADGSIAQLDEQGAALLRIDAATSFDDPPVNIEPGQVGQDEALRLDAASRWSFLPPAGMPPAAYAQVDGARLGLPRVRFGHVTLEVELTGRGEVLLTTEGRSPRVVSIGEVGEEVSIAGACSIARGEGPVSLERTGNAVVIGVGEASTSCDVELPGRVGVDVRLPAGSGVIRIAAAR